MAMSVPGFQGVGHVPYGEDVEAVAGAVRPRDLEEKTQGDQSGRQKPPVDLGLGCSAILPGQYWARNYYLLWVA